MAPEKETQTEVSGLHFEEIKEQGSKNGWRTQSRAPKQRKL